MTTSEQDAPGKVRIVSGERSAPELLAKLYAEFKSNPAFVVAVQKPCEGGPKGSFAFSVQKAGNEFSQILFMCGGTSEAPENVISTMITMSGCLKDGVNLADLGEVPDLHLLSGPFQATEINLAMHLDYIGYDMDSGGVRGGGRGPNAWRYLARPRRSCWGGAVFSFFACWFPFVNSDRSDP